MKNVTDALAKRAQAIWMSSDIRPASLLSTHNLVRLAVWLLAMLVTLELHHWEVFSTRSICGPWGCGATVAALLSCHGFWCLVLLPALFLKKRISQVYVGRLGSGLLVLSLGGLAVLLLIEGWGNTAAKEYPLQWSLFRIANFVDFPLVQLGLAGLWLWRTRSKETEN